MTTFKFKQRELNILRGKNLVGQLTQEEVDIIFEYIDSLEMMIDDYSEDDNFGTEGWEHALEHYLEKVRIV